MVMVIVMVLVLVTVMVLSVCDDGDGVGDGDPLGLGLGPWINAAVTARNTPLNRLRRVIIAHTCPLKAKLKLLESGL